MTHESAGRPRVFGELSPVTRVRPVLADRTLVRSLCLACAAAIVFALLALTRDAATDDTVFTGDTAPATEHVAHGDAERDGLVSDAAGP